MSYLNPLRLHFAGQFQANISTVNNTSSNFNNATFPPSAQQPGGPTAGFNPRGDGSWRLRNCLVTSVVMPNPVPGDPVTGYSVGDAVDRAPGKLVDLDSEQQLVSTIFGLLVRIVDTAGHTVLSGEFAPAAFMDMWTRAVQGGNGDINAGAMYQSVLTKLQWADVSGSAFLTALKAAAGDGLLSIKFNIDGINLDPTSTDFMCGRLVGTVGPASAAEPQHFVAGRQLADTTGSLDNHGVALLDASQNTVYLDLGNVLPTTTLGGPLEDVGDLALLAGATTIGTVPSSEYTAAGWYAMTAGVRAFPQLTAAQMSAARGPLTLASAGGTINLAEDPSGQYVRADLHCYRMNPQPGQDDNTVQVKIFATQFGSALTGVPVTATAYEDMLQQEQQGPITVATPLSALSFNSTTGPTDANGVTSLTLTASDPGKPREFIDGQVYGICVSLPGQPLTAPATFVFVSVLVWSAYTPNTPMTWFGDVQPILQQYANLYPVMLNFVNLADYDDVVKHKNSITQAFKLPQTDPHYMPVTRDLSQAKREAILLWLSSSTPLKGTATPGQAQSHPPVAAAAKDAPVNRAPKGGKASAMARRVSVLRAAGAR